MPKLLPRGEDGETVRGEEVARGGVVALDAGERFPAAMLLEVLQRRLNQPSAYARAACLRSGHQPEYRSAPALVRQAKHLGHDRPNQPPVALCDEGLRRGREEGALQPGEGLSGQRSYGSRLLLAHVVNRDRRLVGRLLVYSGTSSLQESQE